MELESDLKLTKNVDDLQSTNFRIAKDRAGPIFLSRETGTMFVLTAHLRGYKTDDINIDINEDGTLISISGEKQVQEMAMEGWEVHKKKPNLKGFVKVFKIPIGVVLDQINADYNDEEATLTIYMPKLNKGIIGATIEEVKDQKQGISDHQQSLQESQDIDNNQEDDIENVMSMTKRDNIDEEALLNQNKTQDEGCSSIKGDDGDKKEGEIVEERLQGECEQEQVMRGYEGDIDTSYDQQELAKSEETNNKFTLCAPCFIIGSTLVASLIALMVGLVKSKRNK